MNFAIQTMDEGRLYKAWVRHLSGQRPKPPSPSKYLVHNDRRKLIERAARATAAAFAERA